jgi:hypothetical protein
MVVDAVAKAMGLEKVHETRNMFHQEQVVTKRGQPNHASRVVHPRLSSHHSNLHLTHQAQLVLTRKGSISI